MTFIDKDGTEVKLQVAEGDNLLDIAQANDLEMEGMYSNVVILGYTSYIFGLGSSLTLSLLL